MKIIFLIIININIISATETFVDKSTNLEWQDNNATKSVAQNWSKAKNYCNNLILDNKNDWRLPNINELQSIIDIKKYNPAIKEGFNNVVSDHYWSSSEYKKINSRAWRVTFSDGNSYYYNKSLNYYIRCVRNK